jgi:hypothetical protein
LSMECEKGDSNSSGNTLKISMVIMVQTYV